MADPQRVNPYAQFNFLVDIGTGNQNNPQAGFQEITNIGMEVTTAEYRVGNAPFNHVQKVTLLNKAKDVTLKRGIMGLDELYKWLDPIRRGEQGQERNVTITLQNEDRTASVVTWRLNRARITNYVSGPFSAKGTDVAMEELTLQYEWLDMGFPDVTPST